MNKYFFILFSVFSIIFLGCEQKDDVKIKNVIYKENIDFEKIEKYLSMGFLDKALNEIPENTENIGALEKKLFILYKKGNYTEVIKLGSFLKDNKNSIYASLILSKTFYLIKDFNRFENTYKILPDKNIDSELNTMIITYKKYVDDMKISEKEDIKKRLLQAYNSYKKMQYVESISILKKLLREKNILKPEYSSFLRELYYFMGISQRKMNNLDDSIYYLKKSDEVEKNHVETLKELGDIYYIRGRYNFARNYYQRAYELSGDIVLYGNIGNCFMNNHEYKKALPILQKVYELKKSDLNSKYNLFLCYYYLNDTDNIIKIGKDILKDAPQSSELYKAVIIVLNEKTSESF